MKNDCMFSTLLVWGKVRKHVLAGELKKTTMHIDDYVESLSLWLQCQFPIKNIPLMTFCGMRTRELDLTDFPGLPN